MALSRRNVLIGLGALVGGGGALVGTGAFTTVSAERSVEVSTAGDASAFLTLEGDGNYVDGNSGDGTLTINLGGPGDNSINDEAITTLNGIVTITNNAADGSSTTIGVSTAGAATAADEDLSGSAKLLVTDSGGNNAAVVTFYVGDEDSNSIDNGSPVDLGNGDSAELDVKIDTRQDTVENPGDVTSGDLTIVATDT